MRPRCKKCHAKGLFLKLDKETGLCVSCKEEYTKKSRHLVERITAAKHRAALAADPVEITEACKELELYGNELISLQLLYTLHPSLELADFLEAYQKTREMAEKTMQVKNV